MGRSLEPVEEVPAGNVFGIGGEIGSLILKSATISTSLLCPSFTKMYFVVCLSRHLIETKYSSCPNSLRQL